MSALFLLLFALFLIFIEVYLIVRLIQFLDDMRYIRTCFQWWFPNTPYKRTPWAYALIILGVLFALVLLGIGLDIAFLGSSKTLSSITS